MVGKCNICSLFLYSSKFSPAHELLFIDSAPVCNWYAGYCKRTLKNINSAKRSIDINIFKGRGAGGEMWFEEH